MLTKRIPPQYRLLAGLGLVIAALIAGFVAGAGHRGAIADANYKALQKQYAEAALEAMNAAGAVAAEKKQRADAAEQLAAAQQALLDAETRSTTNEVILYVKAPATECTLDPEWLRLHDLAAGVPATADPAGLADDTPADATAADALAAVTANYITCRRELGRLTALQNWLRSQQEPTP